MISENVFIRCGSKAIGLCKATEHVVQEINLSPFFYHLEPMNHLRSLGFAESIFYFWTILLVWHSNHTNLFEYVDLLRQLASQLAQCWKIVANYLMLQPIIQRITKQEEFLLINLHLVLKLIHNKFVISLQAYQLWRLIFK